MTDINTLPGRMSTLAGFLNDPSQINPLDPRQRSNAFEHAIRSLYPNTGRARSIQEDKA